MSSIIECRNVSKSYHLAGEEIPVLNDINFKVKAGDTIAILGTSGAGKSTLLNLLGGLDWATKGQVLVNSQDLASLNNKQLSTLRNQQLGFVYQFHHLLQEFDAVENVAMPLLIKGMKKVQAYAEAKLMLDNVGLSARFHHRPQSLSGGERQRVAIARAIVAKPACVLMDEPTGNLDEQTAGSIQALIQQLNRELNQSFIVVTHDTDIAKAQQYSYRLSGGNLNLIESAARTADATPAQGQLNAQI